MSESPWPRLPPIAPAPGASRENSPHTANHSGPAPARQASSDLRKHKTTACKTCKHKKLKCRGGPPCNHCVANGIDCQVDEWSDMRRKGAIDRRIDRLQDAENLLLNLVDILKKDDRNMPVSQLINLIRSNASLDEIRVFIERQFSPEALASMPEVVKTQNQLARMPKDESCARPGRRVMGIQRLADIPVYRVPAKPWTTVTDDDDLVSHLISIWFTWSHPWFHLVNRELFIRDMRAGNLDCEFCSPFLVNAILAETSVYSDYSEVFTVPDDMMSRGAHFHEETRRLLEEGEELPASIPTIQGLATFFTRTAMVGKDRMGWIYLDMAVRAAKEYDVLHPYRPTDQESVRMVEDAINETLWGVFNVYCTVNLSALRHVDLQPPQRPRPLPVSPDDPRDAWTPYPTRMDSMPGHLSCVFHRWCDLSCIMINVTRTFFDTEDKPSPSKIPALGENIQRQLQGWYANLPDRLHVDEAAVPHVLILHMFYNTISLQLCTFLGSQVRESLDSARSQDIRDRRFAIARNNTALLAIHRQRWGVERMHPSAIQCVAVSCFTLFEGLDSPENSHTVVTLCIIARDFGRHFALARGVLWMIQGIAREMGLDLPEETHALFREFESTSWMGWDPQFNSLYLTAMDQYLKRGDPEAIEYNTEDEKYQPDWNFL